MNLMRMMLLIVMLLCVCLLFACSGNDSSAVGSSQSASKLVDNGRYPLIGSDGRGNMISIWVQSDGIYSAHYDRNHGWWQPQRIAARTAPHIYFRDIHLAVNAKGDAIVAWVHEGINPDYSIESVRYAAGSGWSTPQQLTPPNTVFSLDVVLDADSNAIITWQGFDFPVVKHNIFAARSLKTSGWGAPQAIGSNVGDAQYPRIAVDGAGNAFVLWVEGEFLSKSVYVNRFTVSSGWSSPHLIATNVGPALWTNIAFDQSGNAMAVWAQSDETNRTHIYACRYVAGSGWQGAEAIDSNPLDSTEPVLTVDSSGSFRAAWGQFTATGSDIYSSRYTVANGWDAPLLIGSGGYGSSPRLAADGSGNVFAAWRQYDPNDVYPGDAMVYANRLIAGSGWGVQQQLKSSLGGADTPEITADSDGHALVIWSQSVEYSTPGSVQYGIFTRRFR